jgi:hypothetical protein
MVRWFYEHAAMTLETNVQNTSVEKTSQCYAASQKFLTHIKLGKRKLQLVNINVGVPRYNVQYPGPLITKN